MAGCHNLVKKSSHWAGYAELLGVDFGHPGCRPDCGILPGRQREVSLKAAADRLHGSLIWL
jgi:hypothetical protein